MKPTNLLKILLIALFAGASWSCIDDDLADGAAMGSGEVSRVTFSFDTRAGASGGLAEADVTDNDVLEVMVLLFKEGEDEVSFFRKTEEITSFPSSPTLKAFTIEVPKGKYDMYVIANANADGQLIKDVAVGATKAQIQQKLIHKGIDKLMPIPMWGKTKGVDATGNYASAAVTLIRMAAKVDLVVGANAQSNFDMQSARLYNYYSEGYIIPLGSEYNNKTPSIPASAQKPAFDAAGVPSNPLLYEGVTLNAEGRGVSLMNKLYMYEAEAGTTNQPLQSTCLVVGGKYNNDTHTTYYRVDFTEDIPGKKEKELIALLRNNHYQITITSVGQRGKNTPEEALVSMPVNFEATVLNWFDAPLGNADIEGVNPDRLASEVHFCYPKQEYYYKNQLVVSSNQEDGWKVEKIVDENGNSVDEWFKIDTERGAMGELVPVGFILQENESTNSRKANVVIRAGGVTDTLVVTQEPVGSELESNSYIVRPNTPGIFIPVSRANKSMLGEQLKAKERFIAELVWTDNENKIADNSNIKHLCGVSWGPDGYLFVEPGSEQGNAVVAIKNTNGKILWSWHIWVTNEVPQQKGTKGFMDRNLGAIGNTPNTVGALGLYYQWGRKDPFPGSNSISKNNEEKPIYNAASQIALKKAPVTVVNNFANSVANPATFYHGFNKSSAAGTTWYTTEIKNPLYHNNMLWDDGTDVKTVYDPCPEGWRVPKGYPWEGLNPKFGDGGFTDDDYGGYYPKAGCRLSSRGDISTISGDGFYYTATSVDETATYRLWFGSSINTNKKNNNRGNGFSVRCVRE